jgi:hypothetical protein
MPFDDAAVDLEEQEAIEHNFSFLVQSHSGWWVVHKMRHRVL